MKHKFSIVTAVYNTPMEMFIKCINSVINNTVFDKNNIEFVIVDDGSTEVSYDTYIYELKKTGVDVNYIKLPKNGGQFNAKLVGVENSKYPYILGLDSDDLYGNKALEYIDSWVTKDVDVVYWLTDDDMHDYICNTQKYVYVPNEGIYDNESAWKLMTSPVKHIKGYLFTKCVKRSLMLSVAKRLRSLNLGRITMFDDQIITYEIFYQMKGKLKVCTRGLYDYQVHHTDTRFENPTDDEVIEEIDRKQVLRDQLTKYMESISDKIKSKYIKNREQILVSICKVHALDINKCMWDKLRTLFDESLLKKFSEYNRGVFDRFI